MMNRRQDDNQSAVSPVIGVIEDTLRDIPGVTDGRHYRDTGSGYRSVCVRDGRKYRTASLSGIRSNAIE